MRKIAAGMAMLAIACTVHIGAASAASDDARTTRQNFSVTGNGQLEALRVVAAGALHATGTDIPRGDEEDPENGQLTLHDEFVFADGSLFVSATGPVTFGFDPRSCIRLNTFEGSYEITGGTGAYGGVTGGGSYQGRLVFNEREAQGCSDTGGHGHLSITYNGTLLR